ncbi:MAG: prephenate dehydratase [Pirellulaceae bacterium]
MKDDGAGETQSAGKRQTTRQLRQEIEAVDTKLCELVNRRAELARTWATAVQQGGDTEGHDGVIEFAGLAAIVANNAGPLDDDSLRGVFRELISGCRRLSAPTKVAYLGPELSYSYLAAIERFGHAAELVPVSSIAAVFDEVQQQNVDFGIVPLENSTDGRIVDTLEMFVRMPLRVSGEVPLRIHHNLLGIGKRAQIRKVCSKPQAISQCRGWLSQHLPGVSIEEMTSTTAAAELAASDSYVAAIASRQAAARYGLDLLAECIEDNPHNVTRFAVIGQHRTKRTGRDKTSLLFQLSHQPGALADAMNIFKRNRLNLTWIESFPRPGAPQEYLFFVELQGHEADLRVRRAIAALEKKSERLDLLGSYAQMDPI